MQLKMQIGQILVFLVNVMTGADGQKFFGLNRRTNNGLSNFRNTGLSDFRTRGFSRFGGSSLSSRQVNRQAHSNIPIFLQGKIPWAYASQNTAAIVEETDVKPITSTPRVVTARAKQYSQKGKVFGHCDIGNDEDLDTLFPGIFQSETEILGGGKEVVKKERWYGNAMRTYGGKPKKPIRPVTTSTTPPPVMALSNDKTIINDNRPIPQKDSTPVCQCCETYVTKVTK